MTAALPGAGGKGLSPGDPPARCGPGMGCGGPHTAGSRSPPQPTSRGSRRGRSGALCPRHHPRRGLAPPSRLPAQMPPPQELTLTKAGGAAACSLHRSPRAPSSRGGGGASETQTRVCSKSRAQRHSTAASHNMLGPPHPRAPHSARPSPAAAPPPRPASFTPPLPRRPAPPLGNPSRVIPQGAGSTLRLHVTRSGRSITASAGNVPSG